MSLSWPIQNMQQKNTHLYAHLPLTSPLPWVQHIHCYLKSFQIMLQNVFEMTWRKEMRLHYLSYQAFPQLIITSVIEIIHKCLCIWLFSISFCYEGL